jgi:hypothetical protein
MVDFQWDLEINDSCIFFLIQFLKKLALKFYYLSYIGNMVHYVFKVS